MLEDLSVAEAQRLEARGVEAASEGDLPRALELFAAAIALAPSRGCEVSLGPEKGEKLSVTLTTRRK